MDLKASVLAKFYPTQELLGGGLLGNKTIRQHNYVHKYFRANEEILKLVFFSC